MLPHRTSGASSGAAGPPRYNRRMPLYERHVFVCENLRPAEDPKGCCATKGGGGIRARLKESVAKAGLIGRVRVNAAGCLGQCAHGVTVVVYPEAVWYGRVRLEDVDRIVEEHLVGGRPVENLRLPHMR
jgi:(2Fe-2S) ferredoxin